MIKSSTNIFLLQVLLVLFSILLKNGQLFAADQMLFNNITSASGLSEGNVTCLLQDHEGFMWIGTINGLNKYDGSSVQVFRKNENDTNSLQSNQINTLYEDTDNNLWIATSRGLSKYNRDKNNFTQIFTYRDHGYYHNISAILERDSEALWIGTYNGLFVLDKYTYKLTPYVNEYFKEDELQFFKIILKDSKGNFWFSIADSEQGSGGIYKLESQTQKLEYFHNGHSEIDLKEDNVYCLLAESNGDIWVGYYSKGIDVFREGKGRVRSYYHDPKNSSSLSNDRIMSINKTSDGALLIGTNGGGLNVLDTHRSSFNIYASTASDRSLLSNTVQSIYVGHDGMLWIGCWGGGVSIYDKRFDKFALYDTDKLEDKSTLLTNITCFAEDENNKIWIASDGRGIFYFDPENQSFRNFKHNPDDPLSLSNNKALAIETDSNNGLWVGTWSGGINYFRIEGDHLTLVKKYPILNDQHPNSNSIFTFYTDKRGTLWAGSFGSGLWFFNDTDQKFERVRLQNSEGEYYNWMSIRSINEDSHGNLWVASELNGLFKLDANRNNSGVYEHKLDDSTSIPSNLLNFVFEDSNNRLWIGFEEDGLAYLDRENERFHTYTLDDGLSHNTVVGIMEDNEGVLWLSSHNGITKVTPYMSDGHLKINCINYSVYDGLQDRVFNRWAHFKSKSGQIYFGGTKGFNVFSPENIHLNIDPPAIYLTDFLLFNRSVAFGTSNSPLSQHISKTDKIVLKHNQSTIGFSYVGINFIFNERNQYAYYLEGFDDEIKFKWNKVGNSMLAKYTNLDPGEYTFHVKASNNDGIWNEEGTSVVIKILPPWWETWVVRFIALVLGIIALIAFIDYRVSYFKKQKVILEKLVEAKTADLSDANALLEERQQSIEEQSEELMSQKEDLETTNIHLKERQEFIENQSKQLKSQNKELSVLNATKDKFFSIIAHDLKNPFSTVLGFSELLVYRFDTMNPEKMKNLLEALHLSAKNVFSLLENLLQWSRAQSGTLRVNKKELRIDEIVNENIELVLDLANKKDIKINSTIPDDTTLFADYNLINTVFRNLLTNAVKFTEKGNIDIFLNSKNSHQDLCVKDTGIGISSKVLANLFKIDKNTSSIGTQGETGTGLGLLICKEFAELNGGDLKVVSNEGEGSTFIISMPNKNDKEIQK